MRISTSSTLLLFAVSMGLHGCSQTTKATANDGSGFSLLTPAKETKVYIVNHDLPFAKQVLAHNATCMKQSGCRK